jgi:hypothetical protein
MSGPIAGEPFFSFPGAAISVGDVAAVPGTEAWRGVVVVDPAGIPAPYIIDSGDSFDLEARIRTALAGPAFPIPPGLNVQFHIRDLFTGVAVAGSPFAGTAVAPIAAPAGDTGPRGGGDTVIWYSSTATGIALADGTYRVTVLGNESVGGLMFVDDSTVVHVGP